jgi:hypothetical protein
MDLKFHKRIMDIFTSTLEGVELQACNNSPTYFRCNLRSAVPTHCALQLVNASAHSDIPFRHK